MSARVVVYQIPYHHRSAVICEAMEQGIRRHGVEVIRKFETEYSGIEADYAVFYGLEGKLSRIFKEYIANAEAKGTKALYIDLGYWKRKERSNKFGGYHKIVVNARHPTEYFQRRVHDDSRLRELNVSIEPWRRGGNHILIAGMGDKGAAAEGYDIEQWERWAIGKIRENSKRAIVYRPKPSWKRAKPIAGVGYSGRLIECVHALRDCFAVVTHHSNVAVDAICMGIPAFCWHGVAKPMSLQDLSLIEKPMKPDSREQWVRDISWCQWNVEEMKKGIAWKCLKDEGVI